MLDEERLVMLLLDLHFAGTDTSSNTILTALLYLATHTDIQGGSVSWRHLARHTHTHKHARTYTTHTQSVTVLLSE